MSDFSKDFKAEQQRIDDVVEEIEYRERTLMAKTTGLKESVIELRKDFWEDVTVNLDEPDDVIETQASIKQQAEFLAERERTHGNISEQLETLELLKESPYFGRIDFQDATSKEKDKIYIGIASFMDEEAENFLIYDWRAPISSLYYDHSPGTASYETSEGTVEGEMLLKRQFMIRQGKLEGMFDTGVTIVDKLLQQALGNNASTSMKNIVATIQKEQNKIIRNERARRLIVQGAAGSGKTSAVLQRIAYLMYRYRGSLHPNQMLMLSPNPLFSSYIANVLPDLGETNIMQSTFYDFLQERVGTTFKIESPFKQMEFVLNEESEKDSLRLENIHYKSSIQFKYIIDDFVRSLKKEGIEFRNITLRKRLLISKEEIARYFYSLEEEMSIPNRLESVLKWLLKQVEKHQHIEKNKDWVMAQVELMDKEDYAEAYYKSQEDGADDSGVEEEYLRDEMAERLFSSIKKRLRDYAFVNVPATYRTLFTNFQIDYKPNNWHEIASFTNECIKQKELTWEDVTPYAYFKDLLLGATDTRDLRYLFIDEAQDYSPFQMAYIDFLFPYTRMTLLGDINQNIYSYVSRENALADDNIDRNEEKITLTQSYRSTKQIVEFTSCFAPGDEVIEPFNRDGAKPQVVKIDQGERINSIQKYIKTLQRDGYESIAIIGKTMHETLSNYNELKKLEPVRLITEETYTFQKGVLLLPASLAKGIEFDAVIIPDGSSVMYGKEREQTVFYTACTRAMHHLVVLVEGEESRFIQMASPDKYETVKVTTI